MVHRGRQNTKKFGRIDNRLMEYKQKISSLYKKEERSIKYFTFNLTALLHQELFYSKKEKRMRYLNTIRFVFLLNLFMRLYYYSSIIFLIFIYEEHLWSLLFLFFLPRLCYFWTMYNCIFLYKDMTPSFRIVTKICHQLFDNKDFENILEANEWIGSDREIKRA